MPRIDTLLAARIEASYRTILSLCDRLEGIADALPDAADRQECLVLARTLGPQFARAQQFEEAEIYPVLAHAPLLRIEAGATLERLRIEHQMDLFYAEEIQDMLRAYGEGTPCLSPDAAGFMLRGFFESVRRHVGFEQSLLRPALVSPARSA